MTAAPRRIRGAEREPQAGQVDDVRDAAVGHQGRDIGPAGHVELGEFGPATHAPLRNELKAAQVAAQVAGHHRHAVVEQQPYRPRADAARSAGDEESFG